MFWYWLTTSSVYYNGDNVWCKKEATSDTLIPFSRVSVQMAIPSLCFNFGQQLQDMTVHKDLVLHARLLQIVCYHGVTVYVLNPCPIIPHLDLLCRSRQSQVWSLLLMASVSPYVFVPLYDLPAWIVIRLWRSYSRQSDLPLTTEVLVDGYSLSSPVSAGELSLPVSASLLLHVGALLWLCIWLDSSLTVPLLFFMPLSFLGWHEILTTRGRYAPATKQVR